MNLSFLKNDLPKRATLAVIVLVLVAGAVTGREKPSAPPAEPASRIETKIPAETDADIDLALLERPAPALPQKDPFARRSFAPPAAPSASAGPTRPAAPPLPFRYIGTLTQNGKTEVLVIRGDEIISIAPGQAIDGDYRVESISDSAISMTYLPLKTRQALELPQ